MPGPGNGRAVDGPLDKTVRLKIDFLISQPKYVAQSEHPKHMFKLMDKKIQ